MKVKLLIIFLMVFFGLNYVCADNNLQTDYNLGKAYECINEGDNEGALDYLSKHLEENPKSADGYFIKAQILINQEKYGAALADINKAIKYWKKGGIIDKYTIYWCRAVIYDNLEIEEKALADMDYVYNLVKKSDDDNLIHNVLYRRAEMNYRYGNFEAADADYNLMLKYNEADQVAMMGLVRSLIEKEKYYEAVELADKCEKFGGDYSEIYRFRMQAYDKMGETDKAIDDAINYYKKDEDPNYSVIEPIVKKHLTYALAKVNLMIANAQDNRSWRMLLTSIYESGYEYVKAIEEYNSLEEKYGSSASINYYRSKCYAEIGDFKNAIEDITKVIEADDGKNYLIYAERADFYRENGQYDEAIVDFSRCIEIYPTEAYGYYKRGWCYELKGDDEKAFNDYIAGIDVDKKYPYIFLMRGEMYNKQGKADLAKADFEEVLKQDTVANSGSCRHYALLFLNRNEEAVEWMEKIIKDNPDNGCYYDKACLLARMGKPAEAIEALRTAFEKGYRSFAHLEHDEDMDPIRDLPEYKKLIEEYKAKFLPELKVVADQKLSEGKIYEVEMEKCYGGTYEMPCTVNGLKLKMLFDTGASDVSISSVEASFMMKNGYLKKEDIKGKNYFSIANGDIHEGTIIVLREIKVGGAVLKNVVASVVQNQNAPMLLGQSVLERFGTITIDNINSKLIIKQ